MKRAIFIHRKGRLRRNASNLIFEPSPTEAEPKPKKRLLPVQQISRIYALGELDFNSKCCGILAKYRIPYALVFVLRQIHGNTVSANRNPFGARAYSSG